MLSVLVLGSYLSGKFRKRRDGTTKCRPSSSWPRTDGLPRCEHRVDAFQRSVATPGRVIMVPVDIGVDIDIEKYFHYTT